MPVQIYVEVNGNPLQSYNIARVEKNVRDSELVEYKALRSGPNPKHDASWNGPRYSEWDDGVSVFHKREDGVEVLIQKVFEKLNESDSRVEKN